MFNLCFTSSLLGDSHFRWCLDEILLKKHKLIIPGDLFAQTRSLLGRPRSKERYYMKYFIMKLIFLSITIQNSSYIPPLNKNLFN